MNRYAPIFLLLGMLVLPLGCSWGSHFSSDRVAVVANDPNSLWNIQLGREYAAAGRYELAKEHYLMALASSSNAQTRNLVTHELQAVDLMIKTQR